MKSLAIKYGFRSAFLSLSLAAAILFFQNCSPHVHHDGNSSSSSESASGNGSPYEGKIYASVDLCPEGRPVGRIKYLNPNSALLVEDHCQVLNPAVTLTAADFHLEADPTRMDLGSRVFVFEPSLPNKVSFGQETNFMQFVAANSISSPPMTAPVANGDLVICSVLYNSPDAVAEVTSLSDSLGNTFVRAVGPSSGGRLTGVAGFTAEIWYAQNVTGGSNLVATANFSTTMLSTQDIICSHYTGVATSNALDQVNLAMGTQGAWFTPPPTVNTLANNELIYVGFFGAVTPNDPSYSVRLSSGGDGALDNLVSTAGSYSPNIPFQSSALVFTLTFRSQ